MPTGREVRVDLRACDPSLGTGAAACNVIHSFWVPELAGKTDVVPGPQQLDEVHGHQTGHLPRASAPSTAGSRTPTCGSGSSRRRRPTTRSGSPGQRDGPAVTLDEAGDAADLFTTKFQCTNCHTTSDSSQSTYGPNLTHLASRTTFAGGTYPLTRQNLDQLDPQRAGHDPDAVRRTAGSHHRPPASACPRSPRTRRRACRS